MIMVGIVLWLYVGFLGLIHLRKARRGAGERRQRNVGLPIAFVFGLAGLFLLFVGISAHIRVERFTFAGKNLVANPGTPSGWTYEAITATGKAIDISSSLYSTLTVGQSYNCRVLTYHFFSPYVESCALS